MDWTTNTLCESLFMCLADAGQLDISTPFLDAGALTMGQLQFYDKLATAAIIQTNATMLAAKIDNEFNSLYQVTYTAGNNASTSCNAMVNCMINSANTLASLATVAGGCYIFSS